jgi:gliding motility associated protien GldN
MKKILIIHFSLFISLCSFAQNPGNIITESGNILGGETNKPLDDIVEKKLVIEKRLLPYAPVREADIMWEKRIWRVVDTREKMNLPFVYSQRPLFQILKEAAESGEITIYSTEDDKFTQPLSLEQVLAIGGSMDTIMVPNPDSQDPYDLIPKIVKNDINYEEVKRFRLKEIWYFDKQYSKLQVRILGIAPIIDVNNDDGSFRYEQPLFWVYYPDARKLLSNEKVFNSGNDASPLSWEDMFEMRYFTSYIYKESNVFDQRIQDYMSGLDILLESDRIKREIFNFEHDLWSY